MNLTSLEYLIFFPIVFIIYWALGKNSHRIQNIIIIISSIVFYGWTDWRFLGLLIFTALSTYLSGIGMNLSKISNSQRKLFFILTLISNLGILFYFKYFNFFVESFIDAFSLFGNELSIHTIKLILPIGISFYTFTALSYTIDVYMKKISHTNDILSYLAYVMFFPAILSGPISRALKQLPYFYNIRIFNHEKCVDACKLILWGGLIKLCLADRLGIYVDTIYSNIHQHNGTTLFFTSILYTIQIYADFAGYSLIAIGSGKLLGIDLQPNFIRPYFATTVTDFWRRWHISLTTWFRDYIYFPLGGNRVSKGRWILNTMVIFIVSGLWHGAAYTFLIWGALHGGCMVVERLIYGNKIKEIPHKISVANFFRTIITFSIVSFAWIFFRADSLSDAVTIINKIFISRGNIFVDPDTLAYSSVFIVLIFLVDFIEEFYAGRIRLMNSKYRFVRWCTYIILISFIMLYGVLDGGSFIYFQF